MANLLIFEFSELAGVEKASCARYIVIWIVGLLCDGDCYCFWHTKNCEGPSCHQGAGYLCVDYSSH